MGVVDVRSDAAHFEQSQHQTDSMILAAVDFGTTFSGLCWTFSNNVEKVHIVTSWPSENGTRIVSDKVPTRIVYNDKGNVCAWGFQVKEDEKRYQEFKLYLDETRKAHYAKMATLFPDPASLPLTDTFSATKLSTDFLVELRKWLQSDVDEVMGVGTFESQKVEYIITVPAIWSDRAKKSTRLCATDAGLGRDVMIVTEPEAAMVHAIQHIPRGECKEGDAFVLCDAGGGTVDLITYKIRRVEPLEVEELVQGDGDRCGSVFLDRQFKFYIEANHAKRIPGWTEQHTTEAVHYFERVSKRRFDGTERDVVVKVTDAPDYDRKDITVRKGKMWIRVANIRTMFSNILDVISRLINEQYRRALNRMGTRVKGVVLVGGFGANPYAKKWLDDAIFFIDRDMKLFQPDDGWKAIVSGALTCAMTRSIPGFSLVKVDSRRSRYYYGITDSRPYHSNQDPQDQRFWVTLENRYYVERINWFLRKDIAVPDNYRHERPYCHSWSKGPTSNPKESIIYLKVYAWDGPEQTVPPRYPNSDGVEKVTDLKVDLSVIPRRLIRGTWYKNVVHLWCEPWLHITYSLAMMQFSLVYHNRNYGSVEASFEGLTSSEGDKVEQGSKQLEM